MPEHWPQNIITLTFFFFHSDGFFVQANATSQTQQTDRNNTQLHQQDTTTFLTADDYSSKNSHILHTNFRKLSSQSY